MRQSLTLVTGPAADPVLLAEAKAWIKQDGTDDDPLISALITAAYQSAEQYLRRSLITQTLALTVDLAASEMDSWLSEGTYDLPSSLLFGDLPRLFQLPKGPVQSVTSVVTYDTSNTSSTYASSNYFVDTAGDRLVLNETAVWPAPLRAQAACVITYVAGYGNTSSSIPQPIKTAILMHLQRMYDGRIICDMPEGCQHLLRQYRIYA